MAEQTANYQLVKPAPEEFYDRTIDNENLDKIDRAIKEAKDAAGNIDLTEIEQSIEDLETQLDSKADSEHRHTIADVENLQSTLENKANNSHIHAISDITNLQTSLDSKASNSDVNNLQQQVANNQSNVSTLQQQVTNNQKEVAQHLAQEATLTTKGHVQLQTTIDSSETKAVTPLGVYNHAKDYVKHPAYASTTGTNSYAVTLNPAPTSLVEGMGIVIKVINAATGNCTLNVNGLGAKNIVKTDGTIVTDLKSNAVYTLRYSGTAFILQGESGVNDKFTYNPVYDDENKSVAAITKDVIIFLVRENAGYSYGGSKIEIYDKKSGTLLRSKILGTTSSDYEIIKGVNSLEQYLTGDGVFNWAGTKIFNHGISTIYLSSYSANTYFEIVSNQLHTLRSGNTYTSGLFSIGSTTVINNFGDDRNFSASNYKNEKEVWVSSRGYYLNKERNAVIKLKPELLNLVDYR